MAEKKNFYAVRKGRETGIFYSWPECKKQIDGFSGASYKGFITRDEAEKFLSGDANVNNVDIVSVNNISASAYVDGSYHAETKRFSCGVVFFFNGSESHYSEAYDDPALATMRNVAGEIKGAQKAMQLCIDNDIDSIKIYYDYEGVEKWCTGEWKTNKEGTREYKSFYDKVKPFLRVNFIKVAAHTGDKYNELADTLAKKALGI